MQMTLLNDIWYLPSFTILSIYEFSKLIFTLFEH